MLDTRSKNSLDMNCVMRAVSVTAIIYGISASHISHFNCFSDFGVKQQETFMEKGEINPCLDG